MPEELSDQELAEIEARAQALPDVQVSPSGGILRGNRESGDRLEEDLWPLITHGKRDILALVGEVRRLRGQVAAGGVEYRPGALEDEVM